VAPVEPATEQCVAQVVAGGAGKWGPQPGGRVVCRLILYIDGRTPTTSARALAALDALLAHMTARWCTVDVVDVQDEPDVAARAQIEATPALVREAPLPRCTIVGNLADLDRVQAILAL
jgi:hypothetical protein